MLSQNCQCGGEWGFDYMEGARHHPLTRERLRPVQIQKCDRCGKRRRVAEPASGRQYVTTR